MGQVGVAVITDEFEITNDHDIADLTDADNGGLDRTDDGRLVAKEIPQSEQDRFGSIRQTGDWDSEPRLPHEFAPAEGFAIGRYWREAVTVLLALLIILSLLLAFITRNREDAENEAGDNERIESIGTVPSAIQPREQGFFSDPDVAAGRTDNDSTDTETTTGPGERSELGLEVSTLPETSATTAGPATSAAQTTTTPPTSPLTTEAPSTTKTTQAPTTGAPVTQPSSTEAPTTQPPTTPTTRAPRTTRTIAPTTVPPTQPPTTAAPIAVSLVNGGFDAANVPAGDYRISNSIPGWASQTGNFEIWHADHNSAGSVNGNYILELNARGQGLIYQDFATTPGSAIRWQLSHRGRNGRESIEVQLGSPNGTIGSTTTISTGTNWRGYSNVYVVPQGQTTTRLILRSLEPGGAANLVDAVSVSLIR